MEGACGNHWAALIASCTFTALKETKNIKTRSEKRWIVSNKESMEKGAGEHECE
jgi:hypothetical protein